MLTAQQKTAKVSDDAKHTYHQRGWIWYSVLILMTSRQQKG